MDRVDDTAEDALGALLSESFPFPRTIIDVSTRSWCRASLWTYVAGGHVRFAIRGVC